MAFGGRDASGTAFAFLVDGDSAGALLRVAVVTAIPTPLGHDSGTATGTAAGLGTLVTIPANATHVRIDVASGGDDFVYTIDGSTTPTATLGEVIPAGQAGEIALADLSDVSVIASSSSCAFAASFRRYDV